MIFSSFTPLPYYPTTPLGSIDEIIIYLWGMHLDLELSHALDNLRVKQNLEVTAAIIDYWEEKLTEINTYEVQQRRLNSSQHSR